MTESRPGHRSLKGGKSLVAYYQNSLRKIVSVIKQRKPDLKPVEHITMNFQTPDEELAHVLWMAEEFPKRFDNSIKDAVKAARWIGWMFKSLENLGYLTNFDSRDMARKDKEAGLDIPH